LTVYIAEAHSQDEWPMGDEILVDRQPVEIEERCQVACEFKRNTNYKMPMVVDTMDNHFDTLFGAWPVRFYVVQNNTLVFKAQPNDSHSYDLVDVYDYLTVSC